MKSEFFLNSRELENRDILTFLQGSAFLWGMSVFTTALVSKQRLIFGNAHIERLERGLGYLFEEAREPKQIENEIRESLHRSELFKDEQNESLKLRVTYFKDSSLKKLSLLIEVSEFKSNDEPVLLNSHEREERLRAFSQDIKIGNYAESFRLKNCLMSEVLFYNSEGYLEDSTIANVILRERETKEWKTPQGDFFKGIALTHLLKEPQSKITPCKIHRNEQENFDALFLVNSLRGLIPVKRWDDLELSPVMRSELLESYNKIKAEDFIQL